MPEALARGRCPECDRWMTITKWGRIRHHRSDTVYQGRHLYRCAGSGREPAVDPQPKED